MLIYKCCNRENLVQPNFKECNKEVDEGCDKIMLNDKWGLIDKSGKIVVEPIFDEIERR